MSLEETPILIIFNEEGQCCTFQLAGITKSKVGCPNSIFQIKEKEKHKRRGK